MNKKSYEKKKTHFAVIFVAYTSDRHIAAFVEYYK